MSAPAAVAPATGAPSIGTLQRLDPFLFPADTDARFLLLVVTAVSACLLIYNALFLAARSADLRVEYARCAPLHARVPALLARTAAVPLADTAASARAVRESNAAVAAALTCLTPLQRRNAAWMVGGLTALAIVTAGIYLAFPRWIVRRRALAPLPAAAMPELAAELQARCDEAGLRQAPTVWLDLRDGAPSGLAFGRRRRPHLMLTAGLVAAWSTDLPAFRAVVRHELGHLRNADVQKTYLAMAVWYAFVLVALAPYAVVQLGDPARWVLQTQGRVLALGALVYLALCAALRTRELYADVRAARWDGRDGALGRVLAGLRAAGRWPPALLRRHPTPAARRSTVADPRPLFALGPFESAFAGVAAALAFAGLMKLLELVVSSSTTAPLVAGLVLGPLVAGVLGVGVWRAEYAARISGAPRRLGGAAAAFAGGCLVGRAVSLETAALTVRESARDLGALATVHLAWAAAVLAVVLLLLRWTATGAGAWLAAAADAPRPPYRAGLALTAPLFAVALAVLFTAVRVAEEPRELFTWLGMLAFNMPAWVLVAALVVTWSYPFGALAARAGGDAGLAPRRAVVAGVVAGLAFAGLTLAHRAVRAATLDPAVRDSPASQLRFFGQTVAIAVALQLLAGWYAARRAGRAPVAHALLAAFVTALLAATVTVVVSWTRGGSGGARFWWTVFWPTVLTGAPLVAGAAGVAARGGQGARADARGPRST